MDRVLTPSRHRNVPVSGRAQLSLVEHALCPLAAAASFKTGAIHVVRYEFSDANRVRKTANASVACPFGLSANDELYLYGLLALTFAQPEPSPDFYATPHYCLRRLGIVHPTTEAGKRYSLFRAAIRRLAGVVYQNDNFYDPIRGEHRDVAFGFLKYSLPLDPQSSRAWHFLWDKQFFDFCQAIRGGLQFDFDLYRHLDYASRRLFLLLQKIFWRSHISPVFELRQLGINVLGFADALPTKVLKAKIAGCAARLLQRNVIRLPAELASIRNLFHKRSKGIHEVRFFRGSYFDRLPSPARADEITDSPLYEPLRQLGFETSAIRRIIGQFSAELIREWSDITLAAVERGMINKSPQSYFMHYIQEAKDRRTTPPDWWRDLRRQEREQERDEFRGAVRPAPHDAFDHYLATEAHEAFHRVMDRVFRGLREAGQSEDQARENAQYTARMHLHQQFRRHHPENDAGRMTRLSDLV